MGARFGPAAEGVVVVGAPGGHPAVGARSRAQGGPELTEVADAGEAEAGGHLDAPHGMTVGVGQPRGETRQEPAKQRSSDGHSLRGKSPYAP
jgi:hypothetical protein